MAPSSECEDGVTDDAEEAEDEWGDEEEWERRRAQRLLVLVLLLLRKSGIKSNNSPSVCSAFLTSASKLAKQKINTLAPRALSYGGSGADVQRLYAMILQLTTVVRASMA